MYTVQYVHILCTLYLELLEQGWDTDDEGDDDTESENEYKQHSGYGNVTCYYTVCDVHVQYMCYKPHYMYVRCIHYVVNCALYNVPSVLYTGKVSTFKA